MPLAFGATVTEGRVYRGKKKREGDDEKQALKELQTILSYKNRKQCDCEAQVHDLVENCLNCGRLTCSSEGPGKCLSCGNIILTQEQRERLGKHIDVAQGTLHSRPRAGPSRARIIDDQFDHFAIDNKKYLREEEKQQLRDNLEELQSQRYQRKYVLDVNLDTAEALSKPVPVIDDYECALKRLQLDHEATTVSDSSHLFVDLVKMEANQDYSMQYVQTK